MTEEKILPSPFSEPPCKEMREAVLRFKSEEDFCGRVGALIVNRGSKEEITYATEPVRRELLTHWREASQSLLWPAFASSDIPNITLRNAAGESTTLAAFIATLFENYPEKPLEQGGRAIERRKAFWRFALTDALKSPAVQLLLRFAADGARGTPIALNEWWVGRSPSVEIRHNLSIVPPRSAAKPLIDWLLHGIAHGEPQGVWKGSENPRIPVLFEDSDILLVDKPAKLASVPGIRERVDAKTVLEREKGPLFVVHRLDTDTSGLLLFAKTERALSELSEAFRRKDVLKCYKARLEGSISQERGEISLPLMPNPMDTPRQCVLNEAAGGKPSRTLFEVTGCEVTASGSHSLVNLYPETGRTHQLRVHCAHAAGLDVAIEGDPFYGTGGLCNQSKSVRLCLHASELTLPHPTKGKLLHFESEPNFNLDS